MKAICTDGTTVDCQSYKPLDTGVVLFEDENQERQRAFVPINALQYIIPDDVQPGGVPGQVRSAQPAMGTATGTATGRFGDPTGQLQTGSQPQYGTSPSFGGTDTSQSEFR
jgi:hypothetical protein